MSTIQNVEKLRDIFSKNNWDIKKLFYEKAFEKYCTLLTILDDEEQDIVLTLTEDYLHCPSYISAFLLEECFAKIDIDKYSGYQDIYVLPLIDVADKKKTKSGHSISYSTAYEYVPTYFNVGVDNVHLISNPNSLVPYRKKRKPGLMIYVDDFIGSGGTAVKAIQNYNNMISVQDDSVIIIATVAMEAGYNIIKELVNEVFISKTLKRGISDSDKFTDKRKALSIMDKIESRLGNVNDFKHGYKMSESLVTMSRTPDNTFPVFWWDKCATGSKWPSPFPRG